MSTKTLASMPRPAATLRLNLHTWGRMTSVLRSLSCFAWTRTGFEAIASRLPRGVGQSKPMCTSGWPAITTTKVEKIDDSCTSKASLNWHRRTNFPSILHEWVDVSWYSAQTRTLPKSSSEDNECAWRPVALSYIPWPAPVSFGQSLATATTAAHRDGRAGRIRCFHATLQHVLNEKPTLSSFKRSPKSKKGSAPAASAGSQFGPRCGVLPSAERFPLADRPTSGLSRAISAHGRCLALGHAYALRSLAYCVPQNELAASYAPSLPANCIAR
jgi:hypothetical protein